MVETIHGAQFAPVDDWDAILAWLFATEAETVSKERAAKYDYAMLQCTDSFVWGVCKAGVWQWGSEPVDPDVRAPSRQTLLEARVFGKDGELLLWRNGDFDANTFAGRLLTDTTANAETPTLTTYLEFAPARKHQRDRRTGKPTRGMMVERLNDEFMRRELPNGCITVTPHGERVELRHYLGENPQTGVLRIAATRFVAIHQQSAPNEE